ncbi:MAG: DNA-processing protein DprA [Nocardioidaceae bacterium]
MSDRNGAAVSPAERQARMVMTRVAEPGDVDACALVHRHGAEPLLARLAAGTTDPASTSKVAGWADRLGELDVDEMVMAGDGVDARFVCPGDAEWPTQLDDLGNLEGGNGDRRGGRPFGLWVRGAGNLRALAGQSVAIVGARAATSYGEHVAGDLAIGCSVEGWTVASGGAYGIDAAAHRGALAADRATVCVLAGGIDRLYPAGHAPMLRRILEHGCLVSEAAPGCAPSRSRFLVRNRLIAALTQGTVVVEAALRSGSLNTARWADDLLRPVMGVPGPVTSAASRGVHELLRVAALLVTAPDEVIEQLSPAGTGLAVRRAEEPRPADALSRETRQVLDAVPRVEAASSASIALVAGLPRPTVVERLRWLAEAQWVDQPATDRWCQSASPPR